MYNIILFDLDGTLTNPKEGITKCVQYALKHFGIDEPDLDKLTCFIGPPLLKAFREYYGFDEDKSRMAVEKYRERFATVGLFENGVYEGIEDLLQQLIKQGKVLAVATSKPWIYTEQILEKYNLRKYFKVVVGSELDGTRTIKGEVIQEVFNQLNLTEAEKSTTIMVGDRKHDIIGAKVCGIDSIGVKFGYSEKSELKLARAEYIVESVEELRSFLLNN
jgi:phosphoglycolate phosphatase